MSNFYFDTSALVKHYLLEPGSHWVQTLLRGRYTLVFTSELTSIETVCTFARRRREKLLMEGDFGQVLTIFQYDFIHRYISMQVEAAVLDAAQQLATRHPLRAYDAVHLATAWFANGELLRAREAPLTFVCADERLLAIAQAEGLSTVNPNDYP